MKIENTNLEAVRVILLSESSPCLPQCWRRKWLEKETEHINLHSDVQVKRFSNFLPSHTAQYCGPPGVELFGLQFSKEKKKHCRVHNWFWNQFCVLFLVISYRKCPTQNVFSCVHCLGVWWETSYKGIATGVTLASTVPQQLLDAVLRRKISLGGKTQWFFVCNTIKLSQLPKTPVLPIAHLSFLSVALGHTTDVVPRLEKRMLLLDWQPNAGSVCS